MEIDSSTENQSRTRILIEQIISRYERSSPELQYLLGGFFTYLYLVLLLNPNSFFPPLELVVKLFELNETQVRSALSLGSLIAFTGSIDGARRIVMQGLPLYKAYIQVFMLGKFNDGQDE